MENKNLMQDVVEKFGEESLLDMIVDNSLNLAMTVRELKKFKNDKLNYLTLYNQTCERIADQKITLDISEFLFNGNSIDEHYRNKIQYLKESLNQF
jgi:polysaccharide pyruvyl transferase WcaK-like protein